MHHHMWTDQWPMGDQSTDQSARRALLLNIVGRGIMNKAITDFKQNNFHTEKEL